MKESLIQWCGPTFNPWIGCTKVSAGCKNCYAEAQDKRRFSMTMPGCSKENPIIHFGKGAPRYRTSENYWKQPLKWNKFELCPNGHGPYSRDANGDCPECNSKLQRPRVFCASLADWLDDEVPIEWLADLLSLIQRTPNLNWLLLSKRPENWRSRLELVRDHQRQTLTVGILLASGWLANCAPDNVWIGTTVENQAMAEERIPELDAIPARVRFLSCEPLLGPINLSLRTDRIEIPDCINWLITGGESGPGCRPAELEWFRSLRDQCKAAGVAYFMKQLGGVRDHRGELEDLPEDLRIREFPTSQPS